MTLPADHPLADGRTADSPLIRAYRGKRTATPPVWFMRQAGRSLPEYCDLRVGTSPVKLAGVDVDAMPGVLSRIVELVHGL